MTELWNAYGSMILIAIAIGLVIGLIAFRRPKQRVTLSKTEAPVRPHMAGVTQDRPAPSPADSDGGGEGEGVADHAVAAASDVVGQVIDAPVHANLPGSQGVPDDFQRMKGVGPKLSQLLAAQGLTRFEQIAALGPDDVARLDEQLGAFKGRLTRDRVVEQAGYLAKGDQAGYEAAFGRL